MKKNIVKISLVLLAIALISCEDFLDRKPLGRYTTETYPGGGLDEYIFGMYSSLRTYGVHAWPFVGVTSIRSDDADKGSTTTDGGDSQGPYDNFTLLPSHELTETFYKDNYVAIGRCNLVIQQADSLLATSDIDEAEYNLAVAEAKFTRGYLYFNLVRAFGGVPQVDRVITDADEFNVPRATSEEIYTFIIDDFEDAIAGLPADWDDAFIGRPTQTAAQGLLAKVHLYQENWAGALALCQTIMSSGLYDLTTSYGNIFTEDGENSTESIFEIQCHVTQAFNYGSEYVVGQGVRGSGEMDLGWGFNSPSQSLIDAYEDGDPRLQATILFAGENTMYGEVIPTVASTSNRYNQKVYTDPEYRIEANSRFGGWMNIRILRYADVVLMAAEAANELGQTEDALEYLEMVRERARAGNNAVLPEITETDQELLRDLIRQERRIELAMEHERFFDLVRWGIAEDVLHAAGKVNFVAGKHELLPIPQAEIDRSDGVLIQNPGY